MNDRGGSDLTVAFAARLIPVFVGAAFAVQVLVFGVLYGFGVVLIDVEADLAAAKSSVSLIPASAAFVLFMAGPATGRLRDVIGEARLVGAATVLLPAGLMVTSWADRPLVAVAGFGLLGGLAAACVYVPLVSLVVSLPGDRSVLYAGVVTAGVTVGPALSAPILERLVVEVGWRVTYRIYAVAAALVLAATAFLLTRVTITRSRGEPESWAASMRDLAGDRSFRRLYVVVLALSPSLYVGFLFLPSYADRVGLASGVGATLVIMLGLASGIGRVGLAALAHFVSPATLFRTSFGLLALGSLVWASASDSQLALYVSAALAGIGYGGFAGLTPTIVAQTHGTGNLGMTLGVLYTSLGVGGLATGPAIGAVIDAFGYRPALLGLGVLATAATAGLPGRPGG